MSPRRALLLASLALAVAAACSSGKKEPPRGADPKPRRPAEGCVASGGTVATRACCAELKDDFPNECQIGPCGCSLEHSKDVEVCDCPAGTCFDGNQCVRP